MRGLHWFRADLRFSDNTALKHAMEQSEELITIFIVTSKTWERHDMAPIKIQFILENLRCLSELLFKKGIPLLIRETDYFSDCPKILQNVCEEYGINTVYFNKQYEIDEQKRDKLVVKALQTQNVITTSFDDQTLLPPTSILSQQGTPLKVFTPFKKKWLMEISAGDWKPNTKTNKKFKTLNHPDPIPEKISNVNEHFSFSLWPIGEINALKRLENFCIKHIMDYQKARDFPSLEATSQLSPYLAQGIISPRQCIQGVMEYLEVDSISELLSYPGPETWLSELIWRDFYKHIMFHFPMVCCHQPFQRETNKILWEDNEKTFEAWCQGLTGFPLIDAAMRQLKETGWMHNRLRMLVANFFTKLLFLDWRKGERYFMQNLIDGDLAANNGGWQWSASTGTDAAPYFRIFNPILQSERFDPEGKFIRKYCPELANFDNKVIHDPHQRAPLLAKASGYPIPIIDTSKNRERVLAAFKSLKSVSR